MKRFLSLPVLLLLTSTLLLGATRPARAGIMSFVEMQHDGINGVDGLDGARGVTASPDGRHVYVVAAKENALTVFARSPVTGGLTQVEVLRDGTNGIDGLAGARGVTVTTDGAYVYVAAGIDDSVATFGRDPATGQLTFLQVKKDGVGGVNGLNGAASVVVSRDGTSLYIAGSADNAVAVFRRDPATGLLTFLEMHREGVGGITGTDHARTVTLSPDDRNVYSVGSGDSSCAVFRRDPASGSLAFVEVQHDGAGGVDGLGGARGVTVSPDGAHVYVTGNIDDKLAVFRRDAATGGLTFLQAYQDNTDGINGLNGAWAVTVSSDGMRVYAVGDIDDSLAVFRRDPASGLLTFLEVLRNGVAGVEGLNSARAVAVSPDGTSVYTCGYADDAVDVFRHNDPCGNGILDPGEQCDDANRSGGDCCSPACQFEAAGSGCADDANPCTNDVCNGSGSCTHAANSAPCDDGAFCTVNDTCRGGLCQGTPRDCSAIGDQCNDGGCDEATDTCVTRARADGTTCNDGNACTQVDTCQAGACSGANPVVCAAQDQCHDAGTCNPTTGACSTPAKPDGASCNDGTACTRADTCQAGACTGANPVVCAAADQCHDAGVCDPQSGTCSIPAKADGAACDDGNACTRADTCHAGTCASGRAVDCTAQDQCHDAGMCDPATGTCTNPAKPDDTSCDDGDTCTVGETCTAGSCTGTTLADRDGDGVCDLRDTCVDVPNRDQADADHNGIGDACECTQAAPGRCVTGGGPRATDCLLEINPTAPVTANHKRTGVLGVLRCTDGDPACDLDGTADGTCTFGASLCVANHDPRLAKCQPAGMTSFEVMAPDAERARSSMERANAIALEQGLGGLGLEIRRRGRVLSASTSSSGGPCSPLVRLRTPAPAAPGRKPVRRRFQLRGIAGRHTDTDRFTLECRR